MSPRKIAFALFLGFLIGQGVIYGVHRYVTFPYTVHSTDMEPHIKRGTKIYINRRVSAETLQRGDVVLVHHPDQNGYSMLRRVIALPGDSVEIKRREVFVNGEPLRSAVEQKIQNGVAPFPVLPESVAQYDFLKKRTVPAGTLFLLGDNRRSAVDSRVLGMFPVSTLIGRFEP